MRSDQQNCDNIMHFHLQSAFFMEKSCTKPSSLTEARAININLITRLNIALEAEVIIFRSHRICDDQG